MRKWKKNGWRMLERYGWNVANQNFTNIKCADDLMLYAQSLYDLKYMTKLLVAHFFAMGLQLNVSQKIRTRPIHVEIVGEAVEVLTRVANTNISAESWWEI